MQQISYPGNPVPMNSQNFDNPCTLAPINKNDTTVTKNYQNSSFQYLIFRTKLDKLFHDADL